jgi:conjugal transfer pilus assembly protein TraV
MRILFCLSFLSLTGCSTSFETFDSEPGKGVGSKSITEVNQMIDRGAFVSLDTQQNHPQVLIQEESTSSSKDLSVERIPEKKLCVWIAPFQDDNGDFHEASSVYTVVRPGLWRAKA